MHTFRTYPQMSPRQFQAACFVEANPGCCVADIHRAIGQGDRGHMGTYDAVASLRGMGVLRDAIGSRVNRCDLYVIPVEAQL